MKFGKKGRYDREDPFRWWRVFETRRPTTVHRTREFSFIGTLPKVMMRLSVVPVGMILMTIAMNTLRPYNYVIVPNRVSCGRIYMDVHKVPTLRYTNVGAQVPPTGCLSYLLGVCCHQCIR